MHTVEVNKQGVLAVGDCSCGSAHRILLCPHQPCAAARPSHMQHVAHASPYGVHTHSMCTQHRPLLVTAESAESLCGTAAPNTWPVISRATHTHLQKLQHNACSSPSPVTGVSVSAEGVEGRKHLYSSSSRVGRGVGWDRALAIAAAIGEQHTAQKACCLCSQTSKSWSELVER